MNLVPMYFRQLSGPTAFAATLVAFGCGTDRIQHDEAGGQGQAFGGSTTFFGSDGGDPFEGNFPEPAQTRCGSLPESTLPLEGLISGWGVLALPGARDPVGDPVAAGSVRLRLSDREVRDCADTFAPERLECEHIPLGSLTCGWGISLTLAPDELEPGVYELASLTDPAYAVATGDAREPSTTARTGTVRLFSVTPDCISGEFQDVETRAGDPSLDGGFIVEMCQRQCVPSREVGCG